MVVRDLQRTSPERRSRAEERRSVPCWKMSPGRSGSLTSGVKSNPLAAANRCSRKSSSRSPFLTWATKLNAPATRQAAVPADSSRTRSRKGDVSVPSATRVKTTKTRVATAAAVTA
ncbi:hypothetical protein ACFQZ4_38500 [Catellatospora coxensis]